MPLNLVSPAVPRTISGLVSLRQSNLPRYWATIWSDVLNASLKPSTRRKHLTALDRLYEAVRRQRSSDCLDELLAAADADALEECLMGFLAQLRNEATVAEIDRSFIWKSAVTFVIDILRSAGSSPGAKADKIEAKILRLESLYRQILPNPQANPPPIRALPASVVEDLYAVFSPEPADPDIPARNPFKTEKLRWRNLLIFMLLLRLGLRRGEAALLRTDSLKEDFDPVAGKMVYWLDVEGSVDVDPRYEQPGLKTASARRQIPVQREIVELFHTYRNNYRGRANYPHLLMSQKGRPISLRALGEIFETATKALSEAAKRSLEQQHLESVSCHCCRHTSAVVRMNRYQANGDDIDTASEKLRNFFGWTEDSQMPRLYAKAYFDTKLAEVWDESFDEFVGALREIQPEDSR